MDALLAASDDDLDNAIELHRHKLQAQHQCTDRSELLSELARALYERFQQSSNVDDLSEAFEYFHQALSLLHPGHQERPAALNDLGAVLLARFQHLGKIEDLRDAITYNSQALELYSPGHPDLSLALNNLANAFSVRFQQSGNLEDLNTAVMHHHQALDLRPLGHPFRAISLNNLTFAVWTRFEQQGQLKDLEDAIAYSLQALDLRPPGHPHRPFTLDHLGVVTCTRYERLGGMENLEQAIVYFRQALDLRPVGHSHRATALNNLANVLSHRFEQLGDEKDLEEAITYHRQALDLFPPGHEHRSASLNNIAKALSNRFDLKSTVKDLEEAIMYHRQAVDACPPGHPDRSQSLSNLASAAFTRFRQLGKMEDLEEAIALHREALGLRPLGHPDRSVSLNNLAATLRTRFEHLGNVHDLEEVIKFNHQALDLRPSGHPDRSQSLNNLGASVAARFQMSGKMEDLETAIAYHRQAVALLQIGHQYRTAYLDSLAIAIFTRFKRLGEMADLEEAITCLRQALAICPPDYPHRYASLINLADAVMSRLDQSRTLDDLEESIKLYSDAENTLPSGHPSHATTRWKLASSMLKLCHHSPTSDRTLQMTLEAFALFESAASHPSHAPHQLVAALQWAQEARRCGHSSLLLAYSTAFTCLERCVTLTPTVPSWQNFLAVVPRSLASDAASSAIEAGKLRTAIELLEQGKAILWSTLHGYRHSLDELGDVDPKLANEFVSASCELERHAMAFENKSPSPEFYDEQTSTHHSLSEKWGMLVGCIRSVKQFENFLKAIPFSTLQSAGAEGPVILISISEYRSDAIILYKSNPPILVCLPNASPTALYQLSCNLSAALTLGPNAWKKMGAILRKLWDIVVSPVVDQLAAMEVPVGSRIWWSPTSELCALPLHAAGPYKSGCKNLPEIYISSYTPTMFSLIKARSNLLPRLTAPKLLVMGQTYDQLEGGDLPQVKEELHRIQDLKISVDILLGEQANREVLLHHIPQYPWIHFACHGYQVKNEPFLSYFELHNKEQLTLGDLIKAQLPNAEFAFLSACHSAAVDANNTPNEAIHLAAALQFCGFRSVVGTLWSMVDIDGPDVAEDFYRYMFRDPGNAGDFHDSAQALNHATQALRSRKVPLDRWINFVHIGA